MAVRSKTQETTRLDRISSDTGFIELEIQQSDKDNGSETYTFKTHHKLRVVDENQNVTYIPIPQGDTGNNTVLRVLTYAEFDAKKNFLMQAFPTNLTGSYADDYWMDMGLLYELMIDPIYGKTCNLEFDENGVFTGVITGDWELV